MVIKVNNSTVCSSNDSCISNETINDKRHSMIIGGHIQVANCQSHLAIAYNGDDIGGHVELARDSQGYCQAAIQQIVPAIMGYSILFTVFENGNTYELAYPKHGTFMLKIAFLCWLAMVLFRIELCCLLMVASFIRVALMLDVK